MSALKLIQVDVLWWGQCIGGRHYTADLRIIGSDLPRVELRRTISRKEAKELGETQELMWMRRLQRDTNKFDDMKQLGRWITRWADERCGDHWIALEDHLNPSRVLAARGPVKAAMPGLNQLAEGWRKVPNSRRDFNHPAIKKLYRLWRKMLDPKTYGEES